MTDDELAGVTERRPGDSGVGAETEDEAEDGRAPSNGSETSEGLRRHARAALEAIVLVTDEPADPRLLAQLLEISVDLVTELCQELADEYDVTGRGFELVMVAGGWRFQTRAELSPYVERFVLAGQSARLSAAALETLAIVAYKQPISRAQVGSIRGVNVDGVMRTLQQRGYIGELARDPGPGQAILFGTTSAFLEKLGLNTLDELAPLGEFVPEPAVIEALEAGLRVDEGDPIVTSEPQGAQTLSSADEVIDLTDSGPFGDSHVAVDSHVVAASNVADVPLDALDVLADDPSSDEVPPSVGW